ncbi:molybdate ABC transporter substrate-binding protein [Geodermatophilus sp. DSM 45219]|uniref:molybdate ABC transporter substrate-binding protein n=1 Tax=Geodermatophilus sp. DSM 45219 TaxID=1881103 RepID=UPI00088D54E3|nr:molybdate ABC transporter substrate-binding protein [Geodermatophilus sp. DSM 45219]SDO01515.1 molybdate transport system substrate-binding protein [Geodermatophilus sp. DSM 45219]
MSTRAVPLVLPLATALVLTGCGGSADDATAAPATTDAEGPTGTLTVFAAASLTDVFTDLGEQLEADAPGLDVQFNFAGSSALATQVTQGAPADVFASANQPQMDVVTDAGLADGEPQVFAANVLQIAVPAGNPAGVTGLADLAREELTIAVCAPQVPCGAAAEDVFAAAGVPPAPDTLEEDVRAALTKVELGEVDAALVYTTDVTSAGDAVEGIDVPEAEEAVNDYPIAPLAEAPNPEAAAAFVELVLSEEGQQALADAGFRTP